MEFISLGYILYFYTLTPEYLIKLQQVISDLVLLKVRVCVFRNLNDCLLELQLFKCSWCEPLRKYFKKLSPES